MAALMSIIATCQMLTIGRAYAVSACLQWGDGSHCPNGRFGSKTDNIAPSFGGQCLVTNEAEVQPQATRFPDEEINLRVIGIRVQVSNVEAALALHFYSYLPLQPALPDARLYVVPWGCW